MNPEQIFFTETATLATATPSPLLTSGDAARQVPCSVTHFKSVVAERRLPETRTSNGLHLYPASTVQAVRDELQRRERERAAR